MPHAAHSPRSSVECSASGPGFDPPPACSLSSSRSCDPDWAPERGSDPLFGRRQVLEGNSDPRFRVLSAEEVCSVPEPPCSVWLPLSLELRETWLPLSSKRSLSLKCFSNKMFLMDISLNLASEASKAAWSAISFCVKCSFVNGATLAPPGGSLRKNRSSFFSSSVRDTLSGLSVCIEGSRFTSSEELELTVVRVERSSGVAFGAMSSASWTTGAPTTHTFGIAPVALLSASFCTGNVRELAGVGL